MKSNLLQTLDSLNLRLSKFEDLLTGPEEWNDAESEASWSGDELLLHLFLTEKLTLSYLKKKVAENKVSTSRSWTSFIRSYFLLRFLRSKRKARSPKFVNPRLYEGSKSRTTVLSAFRKTRGDWEEFIKEQEWDFWTRDVFKHPYAGPLKGTQMMKFLLTHFERHLGQFKERAN